MKKIAICALGALFSAAASAGLLVTEVTGKVDVDGKRTVSTLEELPDGARLSLPAGAKLVVVDLASGTEYSLPANAKYIVTGQGPKTADGKPVAAKSLPASNLPPVRLATEKIAQATLVMRSIPKANVPVLLSPVKTSVVTVTPIFKWSAVEAASGYRILITRLDGSLLWESSLRETQAELPADSKLEAGESYRWRIEALAADGRLSDASARFSVVDAAALKQLALLKPTADSSFGRKVLYAAQLREAGAVEEAKAIWKALAAERPDDSVFASFAE